MRLILAVFFLCSASVLIQLILLINVTVHYQKRCNCVMKEINGLQTIRCTDLHSFFILFTGE